uniref:Ig-like domain-containing protein n=1 Tax=Steinernema glaseri TaxID=37863 RepID=A0A1I7YEU2_9BILA
MATFFGTCSFEKVLRIRPLIVPVLVTTTSSNRNKTGKYAATVALFCSDVDDRCVFVGGGDRNSTRFPSPLDVKRRKCVNYPRINYMFVTGDAFSGELKASGPSAGAFFCAASITAPPKARGVFWRRNSQGAATLDGMRRFVTTERKKVPLIVLGPDKIIDEERLIIKILSSERELFNSVFPLNTCMSS